MTDRRPTPTDDASRRHTDCRISDDEGYPDFERLIAARIARMQGLVFSTEAGYINLAEWFLQWLPASRRQHYNCNACKRFINRYGGLVAIDDTGMQHSLLFSADGVPSFFRDAAYRIESLARTSRVTGVFLWDEPVWGTPSAGDWSHLSGIPRPELRHNKPLQTPGQAMAEKRQDFSLLMQALHDHPLAAAEQALRLLDADGALAGNEKAVGVARWFADLHRRLESVRLVKTRRPYENLVWLAVAAAPPGWCHVNSTMIGTLLEDIKAGMPFERLRQRWNEKMHPLRYQRPTAPPKDGTIARAEKIVAELESAGALQRRFARLDEAIGLTAGRTLIWRPRRDDAFLRDDASTAPPVGVFGHLRSSPSRSTVPDVHLPTQTMTLEKFRRTVLPGASSLEVRTPNGNGPFCALVAATHPDAPPILQWDGLAGHARNPVSWYVYVGGSPAWRWSLEAGAWCKVNAVLPCPAHWQEPARFTHHAESVLFVLDGCRERTAPRGGSFFPSMLRSEYHEIRSVMEAYAKRAEICGVASGDANGIVLQQGGACWPLEVRVDAFATYRLDRWD